MGAKEKAAALHGSGFNCAQSVLGALGEYTGLDEKTALALGGGLGGGARCGELCGALSGAILALGAAFPHTDGEDAAARNKIAVLTGQLNRAFREEFGCVRCVDLKRSGHPCAELIDFAARKTEELIERNKE